MTQESRVEFELELFDDKSTKKKLTVMNPLEAMFDDERNIVPELYYQIVNVTPGEKLRITIERIK